MSFDAVFRHLRGSSAAAAPVAPAPARPSKSDDIATALGVAALVGLIGTLVYSRQRREEQIERLEERAAGELEELEESARAEAVVPVAQLGYSPERDERHRHYAEASTWGRAFPLRHNPPAWVHDEPTWERAKAAVLPRWNDYAEPWAVVAHVYHAMGGR